VEFLYKSDYGNTKVLRDFIEAIWDELKLNLKLRAKIILIADELNNNAIEYGSNNGGLNVMRVIVKKSTWKIDFQLEIEDNGKWKEHKTSLEMETMRAHQLKVWYFKHNSIRWRWLFLIVVNIADRLYFKNSQSGGLIVGIKMRIEECWDIKGECGTKK
jgi:anti-sigma regulatory factor (Ser/Thr protein kinase)